MVEEARLTQGTSFQVKNNALASTSTETTFFKKGQTRKI